MADPFIIGILGAECTGKTALAEALRERLVAQTDMRVASVSEWLRHWCEAKGRTPRADEQMGIAREQEQRISAAAQSHDIVISDTTPLMTAVYSRWYFQDLSLDAFAISSHRQIDLTLLTALDTPWQPDGLQRDGPHVREPVDDLLRSMLTQNGLPFYVVSGSGQRRTDAAWEGLKAAWPGNLPLRAANNRKLFSKLLADEDPGQNPVQRSRRWNCECGVPEAELASWKQRGASTGH